MFGIFSLINMPSQKTKFGLDRLDIMLKCAGVIEADSTKELQSELNKFKSYLVSQIKRGLEDHEELNMLKGFHSYMKSEPATDEREKAMNYLFGLEFLDGEEENIKK